MNTPTRHPADIIADQLETKDLQGMLTFVEKQVQNVNDRVYNLEAKLLPVREPGLTAPKPLAEDGPVGARIDVSPAVSRLKAIEGDLQRIGNWILDIEHECRI